MPKPLPKIVFRRASALWNRELDNGAYKLVKRAVSAFQPSHDAGARVFQQLESHGPPGLALSDDGARADAPAADEVADSESDNIAAAQLAVEGEVDHGVVAYAPLVVPKAYGPDLLRFEDTLVTKLAACVPGPSVPESRIVF